MSVHRADNSEPFSLTARVDGLFPGNDQAAEMEELALSTDGRCLIGIEGEGRRQGLIGYGGGKWVNCPSSAHTVLALWPQIARSLPHRFLVAAWKAPLGTDPTQSETGSFAIFERDGAGSFTKLCSVGTSVVGLDGRHDSRIALCILPHPHACYTCLEAPFWPQKPSSAGAAAMQLHLPAAQLNWRDFLPPVML